MNLNKEVCRKCCKQAGWLPQKFDDDWDNDNLLFCLMRNRWIVLETEHWKKKNGQWWNGGAKKRYVENKRLIEECPYVLEHTVSC